MRRAGSMLAGLLLTALVAASMAGCTAEAPEADTALQRAAETLRGAGTKSIEASMSALASDAASGTLTAEEWQDQGEAIAAALEDVKDAYASAAGEFGTVTQDSGATDLEEQLAQGFAQKLNGMAPTLEAMIAGMRTPAGEVLKDQAGVEEGLTQFEQQLADMRKTVDDGLKLVAQMHDE